MANNKIISDSLRIFKRAVSAALPDELVRRHVQYDPTLQRLTVARETFDLRRHSVHVVGAGKAVQRMAHELQRLLGPAIRSGIISVPHGSLHAAPAGNVRYYEGARDNLPDAAAERTSIEIKNLVSALQHDDILIVLISGGGSALLALPAPPVTLDEKCTLIRQLANSGADIKEVNVVRKKLSLLKGGRLAALTHPARLVALILSDVVGDPLDLIASGPTVRDEDPPARAQEILHKYNLLESQPASIRAALLGDEARSHPPRVTNYIIGSNRLSLNAALEEATSLGYLASVVSSEVTGDVGRVAAEYLELIKCVRDLHDYRISSSEAENILRSLEVTKGREDFITEVQSRVRGRDVCLILGGETTVEVCGSGKGGRNQHLALEMSRLLRAEEAEEARRSGETCVVCAGTDGVDGPTDAAGGVGCAELAVTARREGVSVEEHLARSDSYSLYARVGGGRWHVRTGHTHTNVMDVHLIMFSFHS